MAVIGIDSHKDTLAACWADAKGRAVAHRSFENTPEGCAGLVAWAHNTGAERVGIEGSGNYGRPAALALQDAGIAVVEVPPQMTAAARRGQRAGAKTDPGDALLVARIAGRDEDLPPPRPDGAGRICAAPSDTAASWAKPETSRSTGSTQTWSRPARATTARSPPSSPGPKPSPASRGCCPATPEQEPASPAAASATYASSTARSTTSPKTSPNTSTPPRPG